ncbi:hypothetical protein KY290_024836 [Solanum tuberosum]|uniref:Uncharacterized protein n=1 Tax=Solanum tuberosum TaxID=4113 RepID=A0ABQ7UTU5_SOLTU|nr:hypothetical protein KY290_024836 [Solanum tuberosum]
MQATRRLGKDKVELKLIRQEKKDAEKVHQEKQILEENTMERIMEIEQMLVNTNSMSETIINSLLNTLEMDNVGLKKDMEIQQQEKANKVVDQFKVLMKQEEWVKQRLLQQAESMKEERELLRVQGKVQRDNFRERIERNMQKYKEEILNCESEISQLRFQSER